MDKEFILNEWVPALRSGKYKQGKKHLKNSDGTFCCLGVACDIISSEWRENSDIGYAYWAETMNRDNLHRDVADRVFGDMFMSLGPVVEINDIRATLVEHNDFYNATFDDIADALEVWVSQQGSVA